ncbi:MAG: hypothetical protein LBD24_08140 [Spirochaetaceae bacterium]|nr:hypothetical protein [Spirochaetaceae bacterium]
MAGIDYTHADVRTRETFAFTAHALFHALENIGRTYPKLGCLIISTCNRTEIYISGQDEEAVNSDAPARLLCEAKGVGWEGARELLAHRHGLEAVEHLFSLTSGLKSQIVGEQQILGQVKDALQTARAAGSADQTIERLFLAAITCAKRIKTETAINRTDPSVAKAAADRIMAAVPQGSRCLIIGNGVIGRALASLLARAGYRVSMTLRRHNQAETIIPAGVKPIDYDTRYAVLLEYQAVVSATLSPHYTLVYAEAAPLWDRKERVFLDLAVPRDMDPALRGLAGLTLLDIDCLSDCRERTPKDWDAVRGILEEEAGAFAAWYGFRDYIEGIRVIQEAVGAEMTTRLDRHIGALPIAPEAKEGMREALEHAARMVAGKMLFGLRESLDPAVWGPCFAALRESALKPPAGAGEKKQKKQKKARL